MKKKFLPFLLFSLLLTILFFGNVYTNQNGPNAGKSGAPGENSCTQCHSGTANTGLGSASITSDAPAGEYVPGETYTITSTVDQAGISKFGFQVFVARNTAGNQSLGSVTITNSAETHTKVSGAKRYVTQKTAGTSGSGTRSWSFDWTAPAAGSGDVTFYGAFNATNGNSGTSGDDVYTTSMTLTESTAVSADEHTEVPEARVFPTYFSETLNLEWEVPTFAPLYIRVLDINGRELYHEKRDAAFVSQPIQLQTSGWKSGIYFVTMISGGSQSTHRVIRR